MIVNFVGAPCSGKTTTAASLFAKLKEDGHPAEFVTEQARFYIAGLRLLRNLKPEEKLGKLSDADQQNIMFQQMHYETMMQDVAGPDMTIVTDSSYLNAILYMTEEAKNHHLKTVLQHYVERAKVHPRIIFVCPTVKAPAGTDPNRVHSEEESRIIEAKIPDILTTYAPDSHIVNLEGSTFGRFSRVVSEVFMRLVKC